MSRQSWSSRDRKSTSKGYLKKLGKPFRKPMEKDSKQSREWSKLRKKLRQLDDQEAEETT